VVAAVSRVEGGVSQVVAPPAVGDASIVHGMFHSYPAAGS
jgi:hypothetical protein